MLCEEKMQTLYKITNLINGKLYIGITKLTIEQRFKNHIKQTLNPKYPLHFSLVKYGIENFKIESLYCSADRAYIANLEQPTIELFKTHISQHGYNVATGGIGGDLGELVNQKISEAALNMDPKIRAEKSRKQSKMMKNNKLFEGHKHSKETKEVISKKHTGKAKPNTTKKRMSESALLNKNGKRFVGRNASCLCCRRTWDIGNYTQHIRRSKLEL